MSIQAKVGWRSFVANTQTGIDTDAQAFITAASITDSTQQYAINTLVTQLKTYGIWTKLKAVYPFVGGTATSHKFNLKDPRDLDAAYRLVFNGGWVHSSTGVLPNGSNGYADTFFIPSTSLTNNSSHLSYYSRTNRGYKNAYVIGSCQGVPTYNNFDLRLNSLGVGGKNRSISAQYDGYNGLDYAEYATTTSNYFLIGNKTASNSNKIFENGILKATNTNTSTKSLPNVRVLIGAISIGPTNVIGYDILESAFASIGDGLTDTEASNFYTAVQTYQTTLGRNVGAPIVADTDAQAFLNAAEITSQTQASAINTLVTDLKSANIWTKLKALYPFVGGSAATHKFNLKDPRDLDAAYRLVFNGGWVHSSTGALPNGTTGYADTKLNVNNTLDGTNSHLSYYSRTTGIPGAGKDYYMMGAYDLPNSRYYAIDVYGATPNVYSSLGNFVNAADKTIANTKGLFLIKKETNNTQKVIINNTLIDTQTQLVTLKPNYNIGLAASINNSGVYGYSTFETAFASIGDGLTDTEAANFYTAVETFQTTLGRNVNTPIVADTDAQAFLNAAEITSQKQANSVNTLVTDLKSAGIWTKMKALYPFVGGTAASHKFNLKDPRDLDVAFRLVFNGGSTHNSNGYSTNGSNSYADTKLKPSVNLALNSASFGVYSTRERVGWDRYVMGTVVGSGWILFRIKSSANTTANVIHSDWSGGSGVPSSSAKGFFQMSRINTTQITSSINNNIYVNSGNATALSTGNVYINAVNGIDIGQSSDNINYTYAYISDGLTSSELSAHNTIIQAYQTSLGRQV